MLGRVDQGLEDTSAMALNAVISGSILAEPDACFVTRMPLLYSGRFDDRELAGVSLVAGQRPPSGAKRSFRWISRWPQND
jgi:hypothetical protein